MIKELLKDRIYKSVSPLFEDIDFDLTSIDLSTLQRILCMETLPQI